VPITRISHVEAYDDHVKVHRDGERPLVVLSTMRAMEELLPASHFLRIHRSIIVATSRITGYGGSSVTLGDLELPISASYREAFQAWVRALRG
jgi:DNA-binding LytR/AlgR family response regulator